MRLQITVDRVAVRRWLIELQQRLENAGHSVTFVVTDTAPPAPWNQLLLTLERIVYRLPAPRSSDPIDWRELPAPAAHSQAPDVTLDLSSAPSDGLHGVPSLVMQWDGCTGEAALLAMLTAGHVPQVTIVNSAAHAVVAQGFPAVDNAASVIEATEFVLARAATLALVALAQLDKPGGTSAPTVVAHRVGPSGPWEVASRLGRSSALSVVRRLYHLCCYAPHWQIGWRFLEAGAGGVYETLELGKGWNNLADPGVRFFADPFPIVKNGRHFIFFEDFDHRMGKGVISYVEIDKTGPKGPAKRVIEEPWHLSYPFLFEDGGRIWMIPESSAGRTIDLYLADPFPDRWTKVATLISGLEASDATIARWNGRLWMFAATRDGSGSYSDTLSIFSAAELKGPWAAHPRNPVLIDKHAARPAGGFFVRDGRLWRAVQDCARGYGTGIGLAEVLRLDEEAFAQRVHTVLRTPANWPGRRLHTLTRYGDLECIDGSAHSPRSQFIATRLRRWSGHPEYPRDGR